MSLVQKNVTIPEKTWSRLRMQARETGVPLCIFLTYLIEQSEPIPSDDVKAHQQLAQIEHQRELIHSSEPVPA